MKDILHVYGQVVIPSEKCPHCGYEAFVVQNQFTCCGRPATRKKPKKIIFEVDTGNCRRKRLSKAAQNELIKEQNNRCFYCNAEFGTARLWRGYYEYIVPEFDHVLPFAYCRSNDDIVAACRRCNRHKSSKLFNSRAEIIRHMKEYYEANS